MKDLLATCNRGVLERLAAAPTLLAFDFDGTLAPIVATRTDARMRARTARLFAEVCRRYPCAVISGRAVADVRPRLAGAPVAYVVGNHGADDGVARAAAARVVARVRDAIAATVATLAGVDLEDKGASLAIHYRHAPRPAVAAAAIFAALSTAPRSIRIVGGKRVINVMARTAPHKGRALRTLVARARVTTALYVGDDDTDEDVFRGAPAGRLITVRVGARRSSAAAYYVRTQPALDDMLARLLRLRATAP